MSERPAGVPDGAWWSAEDAEWILGAKDAQGRLQGEVTYWRPDGSLVCRCDHVDGQPHGTSRRFHETGEVSQHCTFERGQLHGVRSWWMTDGATTEKPRHEGLAKTIWRGELDYVHGAVVAFRYWDRAGTPVSADGRPLPARPPGVPPEAARNKAGDWTVGQWDEQGAKRGVHRFWNQAGVLTSEEETLDAHATRITLFRGDGSLRARYTLRRKRLAGDAVAFRRDGTQSVRATFGDETVVEQLGVGGTVVRATTYRAAAPADTAPIAVPTDEDEALLDAIAEGDPEVLAAARADTPALSPAGMAHAIARGWGGDDERDPMVARRYRAVARELAPPSLAAVLAHEHLDRMPRFQTPARVTRVLDALAGEPTVDGAALRGALIDTGGPATMLALADPARALAYLRTRVSPEGDTLRLANLGLAALPPALGQFPHIPRLYAEGNRLTTLPDEAGDMFLLSWLNLASNRIASLPRSLAWLPHLRTLYLSKNELAHIPPTVFELAELTTLSIGDNPLTEVPEAIGDLRALDDLSLYGARLRELPRSLATLPLTFLHLGDHGWAEPPAVLGDCVHLETLWIASRSLERLPAAICALPKLKKLMLWYSNVREVPEELFAMTQLEELRISNNPLPAGVYARLREALPATKIY